MAKVSILMNCFNGEKYLEEALNSIALQSYTDWEVIFIDNYSTDNSLAIAKSFGAKVKVFNPPEFCCLGKARNYGLTKCKGEYLAFLDTDDIWAADKLEKQMALFESNPNVAFIYSSFKCIDESGKIISSRYIDTHSDFVSLIKCYDVNMQTVMINTAAVNKSELIFDESLSYNPDFKLFMNLAYNYRVLADKQILANYRIVSNSLSSQLLSKQIKENLQVLNYFLKFSTMSEDYKKVITKQKEYYFWKSTLSKSLKRDGHVSYRCFWYLGQFSKKHWVMLSLYLLPSKKIRAKIFQFLHLNNWLS